MPALPAFGRFRAPASSTPGISGLPRAQRGAGLAENSVRLIRAVLSFCLRRRR